MSRSPWRDALDGQIKIMRELRRMPARIHLGRNADVPEIRQAFPDPDKYAQFAVHFGGVLADALEVLVREAEPIYLAYDIHQAVTRQLDQVSQIPNTTASPVPFDIDNEILAEEMQPILQGVLTIPGSGLRLIDVPSDTELPQGQVDIKAIYFGNEIGMNVSQDGIGLYAVEGRSINTDQQRLGLGVTVFLRSQASGYDLMTEEFGDHLVPVVLGTWRYGETINQWLAKEQGKIKARGLNITGTQVLTAATGTYLYILFRMMQQRITRWGGVALNRTESREAERERLRPRVQLITWRKANYVYPEGHIPVAKNWSCRWSVKPHIRRYKSGKVVMIDSYIKGPPGKPFRLPVQNVHQVVR